MSNSFTDETAGSQKMAAGSAGSFEFGASTPSSTAGKVTVDGVNLNNGALLASNVVVPSSNNRTTGSISVLANGGTTSVSTGKSTYPAFTVDNAGTETFVSSLSAATVVVKNVGNTNASPNYSFI